MPHTTPEAPFLLLVGPRHPGQPFASTLAAELVTQGCARALFETDLQKASQLLMGHKFDAVLIDSSWEVNWIADLQTRAALPLLALADTPDGCLEALRAGADDFVLKPCRALEIITRVQALLERRRGSGPCWLHFGPLTVNVRAHEATVNGCLLDLTHSELTVLKCLISVPFKTVTRDDLARALYQREASPYERSIDVHISNLRRKIETSEGVRIRSVRGVGYLLASDALQIVDSARAS